MLKKKNTSLIISYVILIVLAFIMIYPLLWMVGASFKSNDEIFSTVGLLPKHPVFGAFAAGWEGTGRYGFSTYLYGLMLYETGFEFFHMGYASALSWILFAIIIAFTLVIFKFSELHVHYGDE